MKPQPRGFSLVELVIVVVIVGLLAAIAVPRFSQGAAGAGEAALTADLATLRKAIDHYAAEHYGNYPTTINLAASLTGYTNANGDLGTALSDEFPFGPYLRDFPTLKTGNQAGGDVVVGILLAQPVNELSNPLISVGWIYNPSAGQIWANDKNHFDK